MIRVWPKSLFGRLVIILILGLLVAQIFTILIHWQDRGRAIHQQEGQQIGHRIVETVEGLEPLGRRERLAAIEQLSGPRLQIRLLQKYRALEKQGGDLRRYSRQIEHILRRHLGEQRALQVIAQERPARFHDNDWLEPPHEHHARRVAPPGLAPLFFLVRVGLNDGSGLDFAFRLSKEALDWPGRLVVSLAVLIISVVLLALFAVRQTTRPLTMMAHAADELGRDIDRPPLPEKGPKEVQHAARAFNNMQQKIKHYLRQRTNLLAAVSHDLKTPITRLRIRTEMLEDPKIKAKFEADLNEMEAMVNETLEFMRGMEVREPPQAIDVAALLESLQDDAQATGRTVTLQSGPILSFTGQPLALKRCLSNLIENALKYGTRAEIEVHDSDQLLTIVVCDDGPGLPESELERVFEPFYRVEKSRSRDTGGIGMGLAIARNIARSHNGDVVLRNRPGGGLCAELTLARSKEVQHS